MHPLLPFTLSMILFSIILYFLVVGQDLLIPFVIAIALWYVLISLAGGVKKLGLGKVNIPFPLALFGSFLFLVAVLWGIFTLISSNVTAFLIEAPLYQEKLINITKETFTWLGIQDPEQIYKGFKDFDFVQLISSVIQMLTEIAGNTGLIIIYVLFLLFEYHTFDTKIQILTKGKYQQSREMIDTIGEKVQSYIRVKTLLSLLTGFLSYLILVTIGVDFANFWAFLIFLLNYIPTIGSIVATLFPCLLALVQFESVTMALLTLVCLSVVQFVMGNILEPKVMGRSFNLSPLVILLSLALWGKIWGVVGMFLCVPIMVIVTIVLGSFPATEPIAILLSLQGEKSERK